MSLREEAITAIIKGMDAAEAECWGCDCESCRRGARAGLDGLLDWLREQALAVRQSGEEWVPFAGLVSMRRLCDLLSEEER